MMMREDPISESKSNKTLPRARLKLKVVSPGGANGMQRREVCLFPSLSGGGRESCTAREVLNNGKQLEKPPPVIDNLSTVVASVLKPPLSLSPWHLSFSFLPLIVFAVLQLQELRSEIVLKGFMICGRLNG